VPLNTRTYSDFNVQFNAHPITKDLVKITGANAVVQAIMDLVQINHYEKPFHPEIGGNVRKLLFEPTDNITANLLAEELKTIIANFEPRATVLGVFVQSDPTGLGYNVTIEFSIVTLTDPITISVFLERLR
jgi:phage baseplate assembly protein W